MSERRYAAWRLAGHYGPLALSALLMSLSEPVVQAGLARLPRAEATLAAYGVVVAIIILIDSPAFSLLHVGNALVRGPRSHRSVVIYSLLLQAGLGGLAAIVAWTPLYTVVFEGWIGVSPFLAGVARPALRVAALWPAMNGIRRMYQGVLVRAGQSRILAVTGILRAVCLIAGTGLAVRYGGDAGIIWGTVAVTAAQALELVLTVWAVRRLNRVGTLLRRTGGEDTDLSLGQIYRFHAPLAATGVVLWAVQPVIAGVISRGPEPRLSLAAWPVALGVVLFFVNLCQMLQQLVIAYADGGPSRGLVGRFVLVVGAIITGAYILTLATPLGRLYVSGLLGVPDSVAGTAIRVMHLIAAVPALATLQNWFQGLLVQQRRTAPIRTATLLHAVTLVGATLAGTLGLGQMGVIAAAGGLVVAYVAEVAWLARACRRQAAPGMPA